MDKKTKEKIALFRYGIVAPVVNGSVSNKMEYLRQMADKEHQVPYWGRKCYKVGTFRDWVKCYRRDGFDALMPKSRQDKGTSRKIDDQLAQDIKDALDSFPFLSGSALYRLLISEGKIQVGGITEGTLRKFIRDNNLRQQAVDALKVKNLDQLNQRFEQWLEKEYHKHPHGGINGERPMDRFIQDSKKTPHSIKRVSKEELNRSFRITIQRKVKNDSTISLNGILDECPPEFIGKKIEIRYPSDNPRDLTLYQDDKPLVRLKKTNPNENANLPSWAIKFAKTNDEG